MSHKIYLIEIEIFKHKKMKKIKWIQMEKIRFLVSNGLDSGTFYDPKNGIIDDNMVSNGFSLHEKYT